jgi:hypothetical protein
MAQLRPLIFYEMARLLLEQSAMVLSDECAWQLFDMYHMKYSNFAHHGIRLANKRNEALSAWSSQHINVLLTAYRELK